MANGLRFSFGLQFTQTMPLRLWQIPCLLHLDLPLCDGLGWNIFLFSWLKILLTFKYVFVTFWTFLRPRTESFFKVSVTMSLYQLLRYRRGYSWSLAWTYSQYRAGLKLGAKTKFDLGFLKTYKEFWALKKIPKEVWQPPRDNWSAELFIILYIKYCHCLVKHILGYKELHHIIYLKWYSKVNYQVFL